MEKVFYPTQPERIKYMVKPSGKADVWLRDNIKEIAQEQDGQTYTQWEADETFIADTILTLEQVAANFTALFLEADKMQAQFTAVVQAWLDKTVQERNYDNIHTACTYATSTDATFSAEGAACVAWRDKVWRHCYDVLNSVLAGERAVPTAEELINELPKLEW